MIIHVLANDGSPLGVTEATIYGTDGRMGVGGAELAILTLCRAWHDAGHEVIFYNDPNTANGSVFEQRPISSFNPDENRDVLIVFRSPNDRSIFAKGLKVWMSCDQFTVGDFKQFAGTVHKIVTISPFHSAYFVAQYGITNTIPIDLPVRTWEYEKVLQRVPKRCIFTSMPDRGLMELAPAWARIVAQVPDASLLITSDWRLWVDWANEDMTRHFRLAFAQLPNVSYLGAVNRSRLIDEQLQAEFHLYPCVYDELFCISVAESQVAGVYPITSDVGAVATTNMGTVERGSPHTAAWQDMFVQSAVGALLNREHPTMLQLKKELQEKALTRFSPKTILEQWERLVFNG